MKVHTSVSHGLVMLLLAIICLSCIMTKVHATMQQLETRQQKKQWNKPVKSIKSPDGDIIDCVHISRQPAFDNPLLKNHTIQMRPSSRPLGQYDTNKGASERETSPIRQLWHQNGRCPEYTIPIRRTKKDDVLRASSIKRYGKKQHGTIATLSGGSFWNTSDIERAVIYTNGDVFHGAKASINVWNPKLQVETEYSLAQFWILAGPENVINSIEAGWHVIPVLYGDSNTRFFIFWTADGYKAKGCYNLECPGFVQVNHDIAIGGTLAPLSTYGGTQYYINLLVWKDTGTGNWWMTYGDKNLGYWPNSLFPYLSNGATEIQWGGEIANTKQNGQHTTTEMGSGHFPKESYTKAANFNNFLVVKSNRLQDPPTVPSYATLPKCYNVQNEFNGFFYFGGPGRNADCP